jgi:glycosyltransferase involved in cell wall biosynthesis
MRITFVLPAYYEAPIGGYRIVYEYANFLAAKGHDLTVVFPSAFAPRLSSQQLVGYFKRSVKLALKLASGHKLVDWQWLHPSIKLTFPAAFTSHSVPAGDAIIATAWQTAQPVAGLPARHGTKFYLIQHYETWAGPQEEVDATWRLPMAQIVISRWLLDLGVGFGAKRIRHVPNAIDHTKFRIVTPVAERAPRVICMYHKSPIKGVPDALDVLHRFHARHPEIAVAMFGAPPRGAEIPDWIDYTHNPTQEALVEKVYNAATIYLAASLTEGWALPPAEAMACGCLFVGTDIGGFRDYAEHEVTALLSPPGDRDALLHNLCRAVEEEALARAIREAATRNIRTFTWENSGRAFEAYLLETIAAAPAAGVTASAA